MKLQFFLILVLSFSVLTKAETVTPEAQSGPHQGFLQVAGPYTLEVVTPKKGFLQIYLLDNELKNPVVVNSTVGVFIKSGNVESELSCEAKENLYFECHQSGKKIVTKGELSISSKRDNVRAEEVKIKLPLVAIKK